MQWIMRAKALWRLFFQRQRVEDELDDEVQAYFEVLTDRYREQGLSSEEARRAARVKFEKPEQVKEKVREVRTGALLDAPQGCALCLSHDPPQPWLFGGSGMLAGHRHRRHFRDV